MRTVPRNPRRGGRRAAPVKSIRRRRLALSLSVLTIGILLLVLGKAFSQETPGQPGAEPTIRLINVEGVIDPLMAGYVNRHIETAEREGSRAVMITLDTPGGLDESMRDIIRKMTDSPLPVIVYVAPSGARAASAGTFILMASDVATMASGTNLGAAHPVAFGVDPDSVEGMKIINDAAAFIRSLAEASGRNANWAELAVRQSVSLSADEALHQQVIDMRAESNAALIEQIHGFTTRAKDITIDTRGATTVDSVMSLQERLLRLVLNPNVAYFLFLYGLLAIAYELTDPGIGLAGASGVIALLLSLYAMYVLPISLVGLALVILGMAMLAADLFVSSFGALSGGGIVALIVGSFILFDAPFLRVSLPLNLALAGLSAAFFLIAARKIISARRQPAISGHQKMIGEVGHTRSRLDPLGQVFVRGELWSGEAPEGEIIEKGEEVVVTEVSGLILKVKKTE